MLRAVGYTGDINFEPVGEPIHSGVLEVVAGAPERIAEMAAQAP